MNKIKMALMVAAAAAFPAAAQAVTISASDGYSNLLPTYNTVVAHYTFDDGVLPAAFTGGAVMNSSGTGLYARPYQDTTPYYSVGQSTSDPGTLSTKGLVFNQLSFYWGSIDTYNGITFNFSDGTSQKFTGSNVATPALGMQENPTNNRTVVFQLSSSEVGKLTSVVFTSAIGGPNNAFELDDVILGSVPEPATWATMIGGFGLVGGALRRARRTAAATAFA